uniref:Putative secreted protein n=1 Tax=Anopheles darlingi TaxID=43151 RepID=A0A2M4D4Z0_ANODA
MMGLLLQLVLLLPRMTPGHGVLMVTTTAACVLIRMGATVHHPGTMATMPNMTVTVYYTMMQMMTARMASTGIQATVGVLQLFEVLSRIPNVDQCCLRRYRRIGHYHHHVRVARERVDERCKHTVPYLHRRELGSQLRAR